MDESRTLHILLWVLLIWSSNTTNVEETEHEFSREDNFMYRNAKRPEFSDEACSRVHPSSRDIIKRFHAILPYFDKDHSNTAFLHKFRATVHGMSNGEDLLDKEAAFYAVVLTPLVFLQNYRDTWCLLERRRIIGHSPTRWAKADWQTSHTFENIMENSQFHRALRLYQISHPTEKRSSLKLLQNFRAVNQKVRLFVWELPGTQTAMRSRTTTESDFDEEEINEKRDFKYIKELIKNLG